LLAELRLFVLGVWTRGKPGDTNTVLVPCAQLLHFLFRRFSMTAQMNRFMRDESGATAIEYALIAAFIGIAITAAVTALGDKISAKFTEIKDNLK
jgi:pilus assembly protein Flp/PilA